MTNEREISERTGQVSGQVSGKVSGESGTDQALENAMMLFWRQGAEVSSYNDLVAATGLSRKALYKTWPEKHLLVADTLRAYRMQMLPQLTRLLRQGGHGGLVAFWDALDGAAQSEDWRGCYLFRTASGPLRDQDFVREVFDDYIAELGQLFVSEISVAQAEGDIDAGLDPRLASQQAIGLTCLISIIGAQVGYGPQVAELIVAAKRTCGLLG